MKKMMCLATLALLLIGCKTAARRVTVYSGGQAVRTFRVNGPTYNYGGGEMLFTDADTGKKVSVTGTTVIEDWISSEAMK